VSEDWRTRARCRHLGTAAPFASPGSKEATTFATRVCGKCPVRDECLAFALDVGEFQGVYGGLTGPERRLVARGPSTCARCGGSFLARNGKQVNCSPCAAVPPAGGSVREHGTKRGYAQHWRRREPACSACRRAKVAYDVAWRAERGAA